MKKTILLKVDPNEPDLKKIIVAAEEIVDKKVIMESPERTIVSASKVDAVVHEPWGGHPIDCLGYYDLDLQYCAMIYLQARSEKDYADWMDEWIFGVKDRREYVEHYADRFGAGKLQNLRAKSLPSAGVNLGSTFRNDWEVRDIPREAADSAPGLFEVEVNGDG